MQLAIALSLSTTTADGLPMPSDPQERICRQLDGQAAAAESGGASSSSDSVDGADKTEEAREAAAEDEDECFGSCLAGLWEFDCEGQEAGSRRDATQQLGGWGYTACCATPAHFDCIARHLNPVGKTVESTRGPVQMDLKCPFCNHTLPRSSTRMMQSVGREV